MKKKLSKNKQVDAAVAHVTPSYAAEDHKYKVRSAMETIMRAEEHKADKPLMKDVKKMASKTAEAVKKC